MEPSPYRLRRGFNYDDLFGRGLTGENLLKDKTKMGLNQFGNQAKIELRLELQKKYDQFKARTLSLDITRGKPCAEQLDLSLDMLTCVNQNHYKTQNGTDCRNYGGLDGIPEAKTLFAEFMEVDPNEIIVGGNSSLNMMYNTILHALLKGVGPNSIPWSRQPMVTFLCPSPGYDRHFFICENLGIKMIPIKMNNQGPDMDQIETLVAKDESIKGIWCVPKYSNPTGCVYSDDTVERLAAMPTAADDFRIFWDNAYAHHHLTDECIPVKNLLTACKNAKNPDRALMFGSTSKISFAGAGVAMLAASTTNIAMIKKIMSFQGIGPDKLNQLRHVLFFKNMDGIKAHMQKHAKILKPRFDAVQLILEQELAGLGVATWSRPKGGYFISVDTPNGCAKKIVAMAAKAGVKLTPAGNTFPYNKDPDDCNIRIAPTFSPLDDIGPAMELVTICIKLAALEGCG